MDKIINIDINNEDDLKEKYDNSKMNEELMEYIIKKSSLVKNKEDIKININNYANLDLNFEEFFLINFKLEYKNTVANHVRNNIIELLLFFLGIVLLFISTQLSDDIIWKEIFLIGGWVPIWEMIDLELFSDIRGRRRKKILLKLTTAKINISNK